MRITLICCSLLLAIGCGKTEPAKPATAKNEAKAGEKPAKKKRKMPDLAQLKTGTAAPEFSLTDIDGKAHKLSDYRGKTVVLEWYNPECPFVVYAHEKGPLAELAATSTKADDGLVWLAINSGAAGKQGASKEINTKSKADWKIDHPILLDPDGKVGRAYGARTTPHMYVVDPEGKLVYQGALDNAPFGKLADPDLNVYVKKALTALAAKAKIDPSDTKPYGCSVKYDV